MRREHFRSGQLISYAYRYLMLSRGIDNNRNTVYMLLNQGESFSEQCALSAHCCACAPLITAAQGNEGTGKEIGFLLIWLFVRLPHTLD